MTALYILQVIEGVRVCHSAYFESFVASCRSIVWFEDESTFSSGRDRKHLPLRVLQDVHVVVTVRGAQLGGL